ncbi:MAG: hypothetical protein F4107_03560 [Gemmatimonadetes bacterium]|nr:hypothetical protein [Gemmatimonadota bacterium]MXX34235.1 hypothetical protein [Gemmatimonadota bacterium]MYD13129.1 hypothetical protein [Gemmatimonadota bacterium]MYI65004.1 hypothetical protein [Gemmatimonadota bacterium]
MVASEAVQAAKDYILDLFKDEEIVRVGLEELEFRAEDATWEVTIGFQRLWQSDSPAQLGNVVLPSPPKPGRTYKTVCIRDDGTVISLRHRDVSVPA